MQSLKRLLMLLLAAVIVSAVAAAPAHAQSGRMVVDVPFDFVVAGHTMKAGNYRIQEQGNFLAFVNSRGETRYVLWQVDGRADRRDPNPYLRFSQYGSESFLTKIVFSEKDAVRVPPSASEKEMMARGVGEAISVESGAAR